MKIILVVGIPKFEQHSSPGVCIILVHVYKVVVNKPKVWFPFIVVVRNEV